MTKKGRPRSVDIRLPGGLGKRFEKELDALINLPEYDDPKGRYLRQEIKSKYLDPNQISPAVRVEAALQKWRAAELKNQRTNQRLYLSDEVDFGWITSDDLIDQLRKYISYILGPLEYPAILHRPSITNGASPRVRRGPLAAELKLTGRIELSESCVKHWLAYASGSRLSKLPIYIRDSSVLFTVPKKTEIDRIACMEPEGNIILQRSVGAHISRRLKKFGIDLRDQTVNRRLARDALRLGLATIDLSSASDTVSRQLVLSLLPFDWWYLLDDLRVHSTVLLDGASHEFEMFSSMGNGFTFELESLLFFAIAKVVARKMGSKGRVSVYGDDIIAPVPVAKRLSRVLAYFGFVLNRKKTNWSGPFRESCGGHYWNSLDVTPFYLRKETRTLPELIQHLNHLLEWDGRGWGCFITQASYEFWDRWKRFVPKRLWGGLHPEDPTCLVTGHLPRERLVATTVPVAPVSWSARLDLWFFRREYSELELAIDPRLEKSWKTSPVIHLGERTTWIPGAAWGMSEGS